jgi:FkbM family methyltransferase
MNKLKSTLKQITLVLGLYGMLRRLKRLLSSSDRNKFKSELRLYSQFISRGDLVFDVGANFGAKAEIFLALGARVIAFEPQPDCVRELKARCSSSDLTVLQTAVGSSIGTATLFLNEHAGQASISDTWFSDGRIGSIVVPLTTLDDTIKTYSVPSFCKIDVEGFELEVIKGLNQKIKGCSFEYHTDDDSVKSTLACIKELKKLGAILVNITFGECSDLLWNDWVTAEQFEIDFPSQVPKHEYLDYGDVFVRIT